LERLVTIEGEKTMIKRISLLAGLVLLILISFQNRGFGQYWSERVLEKSFEQMDFFFVPNYLNPYGLSNFVTTTPGLLDDPLLNLVINPANIYSDSLRRTYFYLDFRNTHVKDSRNQSYYPMPMLDYRESYSYDMIYYPTYYIQSRKALEPVFSVALLSRPFKSKFNGLFIGMTYQAIFQNESYYSVPQDIYRSNIGYDYAGNKTWESTDIPIVDRYSGTDDMQQKGHFLSLYTGYELSRNLQIGFKMNRTLFSRDGSFGSNNFWENTSRYEYTSIRYDIRTRKQDYDHWDFSAGINFNLSHRTKLGVYGGYLGCDAIQSMNQQDSSLYKSGQIDAKPDWSYYRKLGATIQNWKHDGKGYYGGVNFNVQLDPSKLLIFYYTYNRQNVDIFISSIVSDSSYGNYRNEWSDGYYHNEYDYALQDVRDGNGEKTHKIHRFMGALQWQIEKTKKLHIGFNVEISNQKTNTDEQVLASRHSRSYYISPYYPDGRNYFDATNEDKNLLWEFSVKTINLQIPIIFTWKLSNSIELLLGLNRKMISWEIEDMTLARFKYRQHTTDSDTTLKENFGERYTQPTEKRTDIQTTMLGGLTISPSKYFNIRLLAVPNFKDTYQGTTLREFQWWIGINLFP